MSFKYNTSFLELIDSIDWSKSGITPSDLVDYIESLLEKERKEIEQRVAREIFADIGKIQAPPPNEKLCKELVKHPTMIFASGWIRARFDIEQLREKYIKGVE
jgi:hypothetical protein